MEFLAMRMAGCYATSSIISWKTTHVIHFLCIACQTSYLNYLHLFISWQIEYSHLLIWIPHIKQFQMLDIRARIHTVNFLRSSSILCHLKIKALAFLFYCQGDFAEMKVSYFVEELKFCHKEFLVDSDVFSS